MSIPTLLTDLTTVKNRIGVSCSSDDTLITGLAEEVYSLADELLNRTMLTATHTEYHDGGGNVDLRIDNPPIVSVTSIHDDLDRSFAAASLLAAADYVWLSTADEGIIRRVSSVSGNSTRGRWGDGVDNVKIIYVGGWSASTVPPGLLRVVFRFIAEAHNRTKQHGDGRSSVSLGSEKVSWLTEDFEARYYRALSTWRLMDKAIF